MSGQGAGEPEVAGGKRNAAPFDAGLVTITPELISLLEKADAQLKSLFSQRTLKKEKLGS